MPSNVLPPNLSPPPPPLLAHTMFGAAAWERRLYRRRRRLTYRRRRVVDCFFFRVCIASNPMHLLWVLLSVVIQRERVQFNPLPRNLLGQIPAIFYLRQDHWPLNGTHTIYIDIYMCYVYILITIYPIRSSLLRPPHSLTRSLYCDSLPQIPCFVRCSA